ncbi:MAG TPA: diguanylate cyclase [Actinoplanes sp.]|nr:diguanylate cyclase [Actinoplanes sp.]
MSDHEELTMLRAEIRDLHARIAASHTASAQALSRATRIAQVVSMLGRLSGSDDILARATGEVAELFGADVAFFWLLRDGRAETAGSWGVPDRHLPKGSPEVPPAVVAATGRDPLLAGPAGPVPVPEWLSGYGVRHAAWVRMANGDEALGYMMLLRRSDTPFDGADTLELRAVATRVALAVDNDRLQHRTQQQLQRLHRLHELTQRLVGILDLDQVVREVEKMVVTEVPVDRATLHLEPHPALGTGRRLPLSAGGRDLGILVIDGAPPAGSEADALLNHLADIAALVVSKALLFERVKDQAQHDSLTRLANRALFMERLEQSVAAAEADGGSVGVIFTDLNGFKPVNDTYGHDVGDALLTGVAQRLAGAVRKDDLVARLGGDEFVILCMVNGPDEASALARRLAGALRPPFALNGLTLTVGSSFGVAITDEVGYDAEALLRAADSAMYRVKGSSAR